MHHQTLNSAKDAQQFFSARYNNCIHAIVSDVEVSYPSEVSMVISILTWRGQQGSYEKSFSLKFRNVGNIDVVAAQFRSLEESEWEISYLGLRSASRDPKSSSIEIELVSERRDHTVRINCERIEVDLQPQ